MVNRSKSKTIKTSPLFFFLDNFLKYKMDKYDNFKKYVRSSAEKFKAIDKKKSIRLISHLDADGISSCAILIRLLNKMNMRYSISIVQQLTKDVLNELKLENHEYFMFSDIGSNSIEDINKTLKDKKVFILDHHTPEMIDNIPENITLVNPHMFDIDGGKEISGAGVSYFFAAAVDKDLEDLAHIAIIGAIGDIQEENGFQKLNKEILEKAIEKGKIKNIKGLRIFGAQTRPLHKVLEYSTDPFIPGVSGSESGSIQFLQQIGINPKSGSGWKKLVHLNEDEIKKLVEGIILRRVDEDDPENVLGNVYILREEKKESPTRDVKEFATLLNACGRMGKASLGIGACLGDPKIKRRAIENLANYRKEIVNSLRWFEENKDNQNFVTKEEGFVLINAMDRVMPTIIGTIASILSKSNNFKDGTFVMSMAQLYDGNSKVSLRFAGREKDLDLKAIVEEMIKGIPKSESGGHKFAAGAIIPTESEEVFLKNAKEILKRKNMEEFIS